MNVFGERYVIQQVAEIPQGPANEKTLFPEMFTQDVLHGETFREMMKFIQITCQQQSFLVYYRG